MTLIKQMEFQRLRKSQKLPLIQAAEPGDGAKYGVNEFRPCYTQESLPAGGIPGNGAVASSMWFGAACLLRFFSKFTWAQTGSGCNRSTVRKRSSSGLTGPPVAPRTQAVYHRFQFQPNFNNGPKFCHGSRMF